MASTKEGARGDLIWRRKGHPLLVLAWCLNLICRWKRGALQVEEEGILCVGQGHILDGIARCPNMRCTSPGGWRDLMWRSVGHLHGWSWNGVDIPRDLVEQAGVPTGGGPMHTLKYSLLSIFKNS